MKRDGAVLDGGTTALADEKASRPSLLNQSNAEIGRLEQRITPRATVVEKTSADGQRLRELCSLPAARQQIFEKQTSLTLNAVGIGLTRIPSIASCPSQIKPSQCNRGGRFMSSLVGNSPVFVTTQWTIVMCAGGEHSQAADEALEKLCRAYWYPLYVFIRRSGYAHHDAEDLTQAFFTQILEKRCLSGLDRTKGKFRSYLLAAFQNFASKDRRYTRAQKRGGGCTFVSFDDESVEERYLNSASVNDSPERAFERQWATTLLANVVARLRAEFYAADKAALFDELKVFLTGEKRVSSYAEIASKSDTTEAALKMAVSRMRHRYGELLREEIANTVSDPTEVDAELRALISALS